MRISNLALLIVLFIFLLAFHEPLEEAMTKLFGRRGALSGVTAIDVMFGVAVLLIVIRLLLNRLPDANPPEPPPPPTTPAPPQEPPTQRNWPR